MCHEILREIKYCEKDGNFCPLVERAREQVVRMKDRKEAHKRALAVHLDLLNLSRSRVESKEIICSAEVRLIDITLDEMVNKELPLSLEEESSTPKGSGFQILNGEPSLSCWTLSDESLSIFDKPVETKEGFTCGAQTGKMFCEKSSAADQTEGGYSNRRQTNANSEALCLQFPLMIGLKDEESKEFVSLSNVEEVKNESRDFHPTQILGNFPGKDFKHPIEWTVDRLVHKATNIADLRRTHNIAIEGVFRKRCWGRKWRSYYGFLFETGVMIYFRKEVYKKVADFRKSTISVPKGKQHRLNIAEVCVGSTKTQWLLKFDIEEHFKSWYETILKLSEGHTNEVEGLQNLLLSPKI